MQSPPPNLWYRVGRRHSPAPIEHRTGEQNRFSGETSETLRFPSPPIVSSFISSPWWLVAHLHPKRKAPTIVIIANPQPFVSQFPFAGSGPTENRRHICGTSCSFRWLMAKVHTPSPEWQPALATHNSPSPFSHPVTAVMMQPGVRRIITPSVIGSLTPSLPVRCKTPNHMPSSDLA